MIGWIATRTGPQDAAAVELPERRGRPEVAPPEVSLSRPAGPAVTRARESGDGKVEKAYDGRGVLRGQVQVAEGLEFPEAWQLVLEPARYLEGSERAVRRVIDMEGGAREFAVSDLQLGGYEVSARAAGMNGRRVPVLLYTIAGRPDLPGATHSYVNLWLEPAGFLDGSVVDEHGVPVADLPVQLRPLDDSGTRLEAQTDPAGNYIFPVVLDGEYEITFGDPGRPLEEPERFSFMAPSMRYPERRIPAAVDVLFRVFDERGYALVNVAVRGYGKPQGSIDVVTDENGEARSRFLPLGEYRVVAKDASGQRGKMDFTAVPGERTKVVEIVVKP